jgi:hypothetical protein
MATHLFQLTHFGSFSLVVLFLSFRVPNFWGSFEAVKNIFRARHNSIVDKDKSNGKMCIPRIDLSKNLSCTPNEDCMTKLRPREVDTPNYRKRGSQNCWLFIFRG